MSAERAHLLYDSPLGPLILVGADGVLCGLYFVEHRHGPTPDQLGRRDPSGLGAVVDQLNGYFDGSRTTFDVPVVLAGTPFQQRVWRELQMVSYGETCSYGQLAARLGQRTAGRAVGLANGRNPISIVIPCHRIIGSDGRLTGYGGGLDRKQWLLDFEARNAKGELATCDVPLDPC